MQQVTEKEKIIAKHDWNEERTVAFITTKQQKRNDSISWMVSGLIILFLSSMALGRITVIGQFIDDIVFNFVFGWFKYFIYLLLFVIDICIFTGVRFKFKRRFILMVGVTFVLLCWMISLILYTQIYVAHRFTENGETIEKLWQANMFAKMFSIYANDWLNSSIFGKNFYNSALDYFLKAEATGYFNLYSGGGIIGAFMTGLTAYTSIIGSFVLLGLMLFINGVWVFTGDPFYLFKPKDKRKGKALRILSLKAKHNPNSKKPVKQKKDNEELSQNHSWESINVFGNNEFNFEEEVKTSDLTIQMPSYFKNEQRILLDNLHQERAIECSLPIDALPPEPEEEFQEILNSQPKFVSRRQKNQTMQEINEQPAPKIIPSRIQESTMLANETKELELTLDGDDTFFDSLYEEPVGKENLAKEELQINQNNFRENTQVNSEIGAKANIHDQPNLEAIVEFKQANTPKAAPEIIQTEITPFSDQEESANEPKIVTSRAYKLPPIDVLAKIEKDYEKDRANKENAALKAVAINETFSQFGVKAKVINTIIGPSVMKFEIQTEPGTKVNSITALENDLKLALATQNMRMETPIPGKTLIGIEIANANSEMVSMREIIESIPESQKEEKLLFVLGKNVLGEPLTAQLNKMPHLLVAGSTGSGKSVMINTLICSILLRTKPTEVKFLMIDPKKVELSIYSRIPHMLAPVISDMKQAANALKMVVQEMERRYELFMSIGVRNIEGYNKKMSSSKKMPFQVIIIDELADLMMTGDRKQVEESIMRITQMARAAGIHLILATQRPSTDVITGTIKTNIPTRIAFAVTTGIDSRTILDSMGAENLLGRGDMLFMPPGGGDLMRAQGAYMSDEEIEEIVEFTIAQQQATYDDNFDGDALTNLISKDDLYNQVREFVINKKEVSTSEIKGRFSIGDARAVNIISQLEEAGVIGPKNGSKPREVLINK